MGEVTVKLSHPPSNSLHNHAQDRASVSRYYMREQGEGGMEGEVMYLHPRRQLPASLPHPGKGVPGLLKSGSTKKLPQGTTTNQEPAAIQSSWRRGAEEQRHPGEQMLPRPRDKQPQSPELHTVKAAPTPTDLGAYSMGHHGWHQPLLFVEP